MSLVVVFDEGASPQKVLEVHPSANTPEYEGRSDVLINPSLAAVVGVPERYWKVVEPNVLEFTQAEKDAQDAAEAAAADTALRAGAVSLFDGQVPLPLSKRGHANLVLREINILRGWIMDFKVEVAATSNLANFKSRIAGLPDLADRTMVQAKTQIAADINDGTVDE